MHGPPVTVALDSGSHIKTPSETWLAEAEAPAVAWTLGTMPLIRVVVQRAGFPMATIVGTLDALHLASAKVLRERRETGVVFVSHDPQQARGARGLGFECVGS